MFDMMSHELYAFTLCCIVFSIFTVLFVVMIAYQTFLNLKLIRHGVMDVKILTEYQKRAEKAQSGAGKLIDRFVSIILCLVMCGIFAFSIYLKVNENKPTLDVPSLKVVQSGSMAKKYEKNTYLAGIDNQVQTFDLIKVHPVPEASELQLYDIVMYRLDDDLILHRIVKIEEPNASHPDEYWFTTQGDAVETPDTRIVRHSQMIGIYRGDRVPMVGSFVMFMQSPAGYLCILLILFAMIATPLVERAIEKAKRQRLQVLWAKYHLDKYEESNVNRSICKLLSDKRVLLGVAGVVCWRLLKKSEKDYTDHS